MGKNNQNNRPAPRDRGDRVWDSLRELYHAFLPYTAVPAEMAPLLRDRELLQAVQANGELAKLQQNAEILAKDVPQYKARLDRIHARHVNRSGSSTLHENPLASIQIFEEYHEWAAEYERVVIPTVMEVALIFNRVGTTNVFLPQPGQVMATASRMAVQQNDGAEPHVQ